MRRTSWRLVVALIGLTLVACGARTSLDGGTGDCVDAVVGSDNRPIAVSSARGAAALAIDGDTVFWCAHDGSIHHYDGSDTVVASGAGCESLAIDADRVYFLAADGIRSVPRGGGNTKQVSDVQAHMLAADSDGLFYVYEGPVSQTNGPGGHHAGPWTLARLGPDGVSHDLITQLDTDNGVYPPGGPPRFVMDESFVYVGASSAIVDGKLIGAPLMRIPKVGGAVDLVAQGLGQFGPIGLAVDANRIYFTIAPSTDSGVVSHRLLSISKAGGVVAPIGPATGLALGDVAVDAKNAYVTALGESASCKILRVPLDGGQQAEIVHEDHKYCGAVGLTRSSMFLTLSWGTDLDEPLAGDIASVRELCIETP